MIFINYIWKNSQKVIFSRNRTVNERRYFEMMENVHEIFTEIIKYVVFDWKQRITDPNANQLFCQRAKYTATNGVNHTQCNDRKSNVSLRFRLFRCWKWLYSLCCCCYWGSIGFSTINSKEKFPRKIIVYFLINVKSILIDVKYSEENDW